MARVEDLYAAILRGEARRTERIIQAELDRDADPVELMMESMAPALQELGARYERGEAFLPDLMVSARAMNAGLGLLAPAIQSRGGGVHRGRVCIGVVKGDHHEIGTNLVAMILQGAGFDVMDLGVDCDAERFVKAAQDGIRVILLSAMLTRTMPYMRTVVDQLRRFPGVRVVIGGAPVTRAYADEIGAHGYAESPKAAVRLVESLLGLPPVPP